MALASRGQRDMDTGPEVIADVAELAQVRRQACGIYVKSVAIAVALVALAMIPAWR